MIKKAIKTFLILGLYLAFTPVVPAKSNVSVLWEEEIEQAGRSLKTYTMKVTDDNIIRIIALSHIPRRKDPKLIEYRINLTNHKSEIKDLLPMDEEDITILLPEAAIKDSRLIDDNIIIIRNQYKSYNLQELTINYDWQVKTREIPGLTRNSVSTHGACRNLYGDMFLCGNSGYIRKVGKDGDVIWDTNYKSNKSEDGTLSVSYSESEKVLVAFGMSFEPDTKFTTKDSNLWLAMLDSKGNFIEKTEFKGIANFGKFPTFCLSQSDHPIVIYDTSSELNNCNIAVSKFSRDLKNKEWTTTLFEGKDVMVSQISLTPFEGDFILVKFHCMKIFFKEDSTLAEFQFSNQKGINPYFYILDKNGKIVNRAAFEEISSVGVGLLVAAAQNKIFIVGEDRKRDKDIPTNFLKLTCFKINCGESL